MAIQRKTYKGMITDTNEVYVCDFDSDIASLPTDSPAGSTAFVIEDSSEWMIDSSGQWTAVTIGGAPGDITLKTLSVDENGTFTAPRGTAYNKIIASVAGRSAGTSSVVHDALENVTVASVPDMDGGKEFDRLVIGIDPVQDLNGYDAPWPAYGGKNLLDDSQKYFTSGSIYFGGGDKYKRTKPRASCGDLYVFGRYGGRYSVESVSYRH